MTMTTKPKSGPARWRQSLYRFFCDVLTLEDGRSYGEALDRWQMEDFKTAFDEQAKHIWWERPRGHSKTADAAALALHHLLTKPGARAYVAATDRDQAALVADTITGFIARSPLLRDALQVQKWRIVAPSTRSILEILPADAASSWGLRPSLLIVDEIEAWHGDRAEQFFQSLFSSLGKVKGARLIVIGTAGWDRNGLAWHLREQVQDDPAWLFSRRGQVASWVSPEFLEQQRRLLPAHVYAMLHLNEWTQAGGEFLTWDEIDGIFSGTPAGEGTPFNFMGIDLATSRDRTAISTIQGKGESVHVLSLDTWQGTANNRVQLADVEDSIVALADRFKPAGIYLDPFQGLLLAERLRMRRLPVHEYSFTSTSRTALFDTLLLLIRQHRLTSPDFPILREELTGLRWVEKGGILRPDHPTTGHDDAVISVALAAQGAVKVDIYSKRPKRIPRASSSFYKSSRRIRDESDWKKPSIII